RAIMAEARIEYGLGAHEHQVTLPLQSVDQIRTQPLSPLAEVQTLPLSSISTQEKDTPNGVLEESHPEDDDDATIRLPSVKREKKASRQTTIQVEGQ
ncbi:MAG TPA: hypothetical protein VFN35_15375, partial [Ktedonobacteraceae bacterium]|nr:hypothetical protein [Ktedonobacteraceae bacterium]